MARKIVPDIQIGAHTAELIAHSVFDNKKLEGYEPLRLAGDKAVRVEAVSKFLPMREVHARERGADPVIAVPLIREGWKLAYDHNKERTPLATSTAQACLILGERALFGLAGFRLPADLYSGDVKLPSWTAVHMGLVKGIEESIRGGGDFKSSTAYFKDVESYMMRRHKALRARYDEGRTDSLYQTMCLFAGRFVEAARKHVKTSGV